MKPIAFTAALVFAAALSSTPASAQFFRTFVSGTGSDSNPCTRTQPCLTFQRAHDNTFAGGEIDVLDPGGYGPFVIDKAISIVNDGVGTVGIRARAGGTAISINAGVSDVISLRGLTIEGAGVGVTGIQFNTGALLTVRNCVIRNFTNDGINAYPTAGTTRLFVSDSLVADNGFYGIFVFPTVSASASATFNRVEVNNNANGNIVLQGDSTTGSTDATVSDSVISGSHSTIAIGYGLYALASSLTVYHSVIAKNDYGVRTQLGGILRLAQSAVTGNVAGYSGTIQTYGDNYIDGNGSAPGGATLVPINRQ